MPDPATTTDAAAAADSETARLDARLAEMPREVGVLLVSIGVMGIALPGIVGTPALLAGGLLLWPRGFRSINTWVRRRFPKTHSHGIGQLLRYLDDMERRYPSSGCQGQRAEACEDSARPPRQGCGHHAPGPDSVGCTVVDDCTNPP